MLAQTFLGLSLLGAEWVLYLLLGLSVLSVGIIIERVLFFHHALSGICDFRQKFRALITSDKWNEAKSLSESRLDATRRRPPDFEGGLISTMIENKNSHSAEVLNEIAADSLLQTRLRWEKNLSILATIGSNAPFIGLFGTVLGIIQAFHEISQKSGLDVGAQRISAGLADALVATAVGILVAIPAVVAFNLFQRKVRAAVSEAEAMKSFLIGKIIGGTKN